MVGSETWSNQIASLQLVDYVDNDAVKGAVAAFNDGSGATGVLLDNAILLESSDPSGSQVDSQVLPNRTSQMVLLEEMSGCSQLTWHVRVFCQTHGKKIIGLTILQVTQC